MRVWIFAAALLITSPALAQVTITIDTSLAERTLAVLCTGDAVDEAEVRASPVVQAQVSHNTGIRDTATMDAYIAALRGASACQAPQPDAFLVSALIENREAFRTKVAAIKARQAEIAAAVSARLAPYMPEGASFEGSVVLAVPYFSCGGFAADNHFFIDVRCLDPNLDLDILALELLVAHETYHVIQARHFVAGPAEIRTRRDALSAFFTNLLNEGSATHVGTPTLLPTSGGGPFTRLGRRFHADNQQRMETNFALMTLLIDDLARARDPEARLDRAAMIAFSGGTYDEMGYHVGAHMMRDIEAAWGAPALVCIFQLPAEQLILAHDAVVAGRPNALRLGPEAVQAARVAARGRAQAQRFEACRA